MGNSTVSSRASDILQPV